jgi:hypothetical protein
MRSARSQSVADFPIGAHRGLRHHRGSAKEYCPSSSAVARHFGIRYRRRELPIPRSRRAGHGRMTQAQDCGLETICARAAVAAATNRSARVSGSPTSAGASPWLATIWGSMLR